VIIGDFSFGAFNGDDFLLLSPLVLVLTPHHSKNRSCDWEISVLSISRVTKAIFWFYLGGKRVV
jgi:hypothetical protein